jgi:PadR family transcriptional regulator PadR
MPVKKKIKKITKTEQNKIIKKQIFQLNIDLKRALLPYVILFFLKIRPHYPLEVQKKMASLEKGVFRIRQNIIYQNFQKLQAKGIVASYMEKSKIGAKRKYYYLTELGERLFEEVVFTRLAPQFFMFTTIMGGRMDEFGTKHELSMKELESLEKRINKVIDK